MSDSILDRLEESRVFSITDKDDGTFNVEENCDYYFSVLLTKDELLQLSREIADLANSLTEVLPEAQKQL